VVALGYITRINTPLTSHGRSEKTTVDWYKTGTAQMFCALMAYPYGARAFGDPIHHQKREPQEVPMGLRIGTEL